MPQQRFQKRSPRIARAFLRHFLPSEIREPVLGDFEESFGEKVVFLGPSRAIIWYWSQAIRSVVSCLTGKFGEQFGIIYTHFEAATQKLARHRRYSISNIIGLALAFTCCLLITVYIAHDLSFDGYHKNADRIFRITAQDRAAFPGPLGPQLRRGIPHIEQSARLSTLNIVNQAQIKQGNKNYSSDMLLFADSEAFSIFDWKLVNQYNGRLLSDPFSVVLSQSAAAMIFGRNNPIGNRINIDNHDYMILGVMEDIPTNSYIRADFIMSFSSLDSLLRFNNYPQEWISSWHKSYSSIPTYILLDDSRYKTEVAKAIMGVIDESKAAMGYKQDLGEQIQLQPLKDIYLGSTIDYYQVGKNGDPKLLIMMGVALLVILVVAGINIIHWVVTIWQADVRLISVHLAYRRRFRLFLNFASESFLIIILALTLALFASRLSLPFFARLVNRDLLLQTVLIPWAMLLSIPFALVTSASAIINPEAFLPETDEETRKGGVAYREYYRTRHGRLFLVFQFLVAGILVFATVIMIAQTRFLNSMPLGYDKDNLLILPLNPGAFNAHQVEEIKNTLLDLPVVESASASFAVPAACPPGGDNYYIKALGNDQSSCIRAHFFTADSDFWDVYKIQILTKTKEEIIKTDSVIKMLNRSAARALGWDNPEEAVGQQIELFYLTNTDTTHIHFAINSVFENYQQCYIDHNAIPLVICVDPAQYFWYLTLRLKAGTHDDAIAAIRSAWTHLEPNIVFAPYFLADRLSEINKEECLMARQLLPLALIVLFITYIGLFELISYTIYQKESEIASWLSRGNSRVKVISRLSGGFVLMILIGTILAWPISFSATKLWLDRFAVHLEPGVELFLLAGGGVILLGILIAIFPALVFVFYLKRFSKERQEIACSHYLTCIRQKSDRF